MDVAEVWEINKSGVVKKNVFLHSVSALQILHQCTVLSGFHATALEWRNFLLQFLLLQYFIQVLQNLFS